MAQTETKIYGSVGSETTGSAPNPESPLNPGNVLDVEKWTNTSDITLYGNIRPERITGATALGDIQSPGMGHVL